MKVAHLVTSSPWRLLIQQPRPHGGCAISNLVPMKVANLVIFWQYFKFMWQLLFVPYTEAKKEKKQKNENKILPTETAIQRCC